MSIFESKRYQLVLDANTNTFSVSTTLFKGSVAELKEQAVYEYQSDFWLDSVCWNCNSTQSHLLNRRSPCVLGCRVCNVVYIDGVSIGSKIIFKGV